MRGELLSLRQRFSLGHICGSSFGSWVSQRINKRDTCTTDFKIIESLMVLKSRPLTTLKMIKGQGWILKRIVGASDTSVLFAYFVYFHCEPPTKLSLSYFTFPELNHRQSCVETSRNLPEPRMKRHLGSRTWLHGLHHFFRTSDIKITTFSSKKRWRYSAKKVTKVQFAELRDLYHF